MIEQQKVETDCEVEQENVHEFHILIQIKNISTLFFQLQLRLRLLLYM